jgi:polysaccharide deacetylase family protein (PEP-CTERM system associated)
LTVDVEDYYHVSAFARHIRREDWPALERRVERNTHRLLDSFDAYGVRATFFVLGIVAEESSGLVTEICNRGHEVASHGYAHELVYNQTPQRFREETLRSKALLEDVTGKPVLGYRAASYSVTRRSMWALDVLAELGFAYDSSIFPIRHDRYGIHGFPRFPHQIRNIDGRGIMEFPLSTARVLGRNLPIAGGGYFRILPPSFTHWGIRRVNQRDEQPVIIYLHPWELDPDQPRQQVRWLTRFRHYYNLHKTEDRLIGLLQRFKFDTVARVLEIEAQRTGIQMVDDDGR